jgi:hypothetical protein
MKKMIFLVLISFLCTSFLFAQKKNPALEKYQKEIQLEFTEPFGGGEGFRYQVRNVKIANSGPILIAKKGGQYPVSMEILHDCISCGNAVNQVIVGLAGEQKAQLSVWNGKQRSGGTLLVVNPETDVEAYCEDNDGDAQWVKVQFSIKIPNKKGVYYLRTRYAQDYQGNIYTQEGLKKKQPIYKKVLGWWTVDRPQGPGAEANIGVIVLE